MNSTKILDECGITQEDLLTHWQAYQNLSLNSSDKKLNAIPQANRDKIAKFYARMREAGYYPDKPGEKVMMFCRTIPITKSREVQKITRTDCKFGECKQCPVIIYPERTSCVLRTREWRKSCDNIMNGWPRDKGEGKIMAEQVIDYMQTEFMGGIR